MSRSFPVPGWTWLAALLSLVALAFAMVFRIGPPQKAGTLVIHAAAALRGLLEEAGPQYERMTGVAIERRYGNSQSILTALELSGGDLFLPADDSYIADARGKRLVDEPTTLAKMTAVIVLRPGLSQYSDELTLIQANPDAAAIGRRTREVLQARGQWDAVAGRTKAYVATVTDVAAAVRLQTADAGVVWDVVAGAFADLTVVRPARFDGITANVGISVVTASTQKAKARSFIEYLADSPDLFRRHGFAGAKP